MVIADFEAGIGSLLRAETGQMDVAIVVAEPHPRSIEVARRLIALAEENRIPRRLLVANKIRDDTDLDYLRGQLDGAEPDFVIPEDDEIRRADFDGAAPLDRNADTPAVRALSELAATLA